MLFNLYLISILYTNTMGLLIKSRCNPIIKYEYEKKGYKKVEKNDTEFVIDVVVSSVKFLIPGYYLKEALKMSGKNFDIDKIIETKVKNKEISLIDEPLSIMNPDDSIFRDDRLDKVRTLSNTPTYKVGSMYSKERYPNVVDFDRDFWEEEESSLTPFVEPEVVEENVKNPMKSYVENISEEELNSLSESIEAIRKLKRVESQLLNSSNKAA